MVAPRAGADVADGDACAYHGHYQRGTLAACSRGTRCRELAEELPAIFDPREAMRPGAPLLHPEYATYQGANQDIPDVRKP